MTLYQNTQSVIIFFFVLIGTFFTHLDAHNFGNFEHFKKDIKDQYINKTTADIAQHIKDGRSIKEEFKHHLNEYNSKGGYSLLSNAPQTPEDYIASAFEEKGKELINEYESASWKKAACMAVMGVGALFIGAAINEKDSRASTLAGTMGVTFIISAAYGRSCYKKKTDTLPDHIKAIHVMGEIWESTYGKC